MPKKQVSNETPRCSKGKFNLRIKPACPLPDLTDDEDADGDPDAEFQKQALSSITSKIFCLKYLWFEIRSFSVWAKTNYIKC